MLQSLHQILGYHVHATDGDLGHLDDLYFDDRTWAVRYLVVDTRHWLSGRRVLLAPQKAGPPEAAARRLPIALTKDQIRASPDIGTDLPVSRQKETALAQYYGWMGYWEEPGVQLLIPPQSPAGNKEPDNQNRGDPDLRSLHEVLRYDVLAVDGPAGRVGDFLGDAGDWTIRGVVVAIGPLLHRKKVLMSPNDVQGIVWSGGSLRTKLNHREVEQLPAYGAAVPAAS